MNTRFINVLTLMALLTPSTHAQVSEAIGNELKRLHKCYSLFTHTMISESDTLWVQVKNGQKNGTQACLEVLSRADLTSGGQSIANGANNQVGQKILSNMLNFYKLGFKAPDYSSRMTGRDIRTVDVIDSNSPAYHFLYSLFKPSEQFSSVVTRKSSVRAIRYSTKPNRSRSASNYGKNYLFEGGKAALGSTYDDCMLASATKGGKFDSMCAIYMWTGYIEAVRVVTSDGRERYGRIPDEKYLHPVQKKTIPAVPFYPTVVETGLLVGLKPDTTKNIVPWLSDYLTNNDINQHRGGGVLGDQAYLLANVNFLNYDQDGAAKMQRRYGENVFEDFLCKKNPVLRSIDVVNEVKSNSSISFRQGISCMRCHAGMDALSAVTRNISYRYSMGGSDRIGSVAFFGDHSPAAHASNKARKVLLGETGPVSGYAVTANIGRLYYRSYDGTLVDEMFEGFQELGEKLAQKDDFYACAAQKHFKFLTGIEVNLGDEGDMNFPTLSAAEKKYRDQVIQLGKSLRQHQSLKKLFEEIIKSPTFINPDKGV